MFKKRKRRSALQVFASTVKIQMTTIPLSVATALFGMPNKTVDWNVYADPDDG